ncbi:hypothetical protein SNK03_010175 [Fusarium graminearum]|uniref:Chromosome 4, complete genome n=1 Tax=Gibberella zeae (strain ATCC MYA-4620 / CBS 123657 / FGSC 9075 / NRRL 31084 / PH-1) TaxID=229533 RepID=I1S9K1_GIBZE|nr:hypothetical protein FGSG_13532 [Fusarium graminearum PH-1]ESU15779.1 hypothetical protein FGSG_13532 [Fusarium graminearum PH-1]CEF85479.1 unnamed protein product [Fusarium graminearum]CZS74710.1 unnamed protein product [Fusarium graminearum]|eukprot:XP_011328537.1 hypothetical protein FGSG_13532 [Fusarium graminearum PH-1]
MDAAMKPCFEFSSSLCVCAGLVHIPGIPRITTESKRPWQCFTSLFRVENDKKIVSRTQRSRLSQLPGETGRTTHHPPIELHDLTNSLLAGQAALAEATYVS